MPQLIILRGLPASGKSTLAKELAEKSGNAIRVNRDLLRTMLHFDKWTGRNEEMTRKAERELIKFFLAMGKQVIVDDTNLSEKTLQSMKSLSPDSNQVIDVDTSFGECLMRDRERDDRVGDDVIFRMARRYGKYPEGRDEIICDIDGTIADLTHRLDFVNGEQKDWDSFFTHMVNDAPRKEIIDEVNELGKHYDVILVTGRPEKYRWVTRDWLKWNNVKYNWLLMREDHDKRPDDQVKGDILRFYFNKEKVKLVIDDRPSVIRMWRENGLEVKDVGNGKEF